MHVGIMFSMFLMGQWHTADEYDGQVREITFRSLCNSPMCPPDTAMTEWQHHVLSPDKTNLVFETVQQAHDVPFGSYFEVHCKWSLETINETSCTLDIKVAKLYSHSTRCLPAFPGTPMSSSTPVPLLTLCFHPLFCAHFKKWCVMQSKIKSGAVNEYKKEVDVMLDVARSYIKSNTPNDEDDKASSPPPAATGES
ncbi:BAG-associated GRAM protein 1 [Glycine soja]|uniref:BAG-associated GRAM protein 1 n=1 Tax=Glycine soja TaxID=3848 RepID=A0A445LNU9_GLYSO|nr:BAG-associated GRAM protein 1 [Glycine soja]